MTDKEQQAKDNYDLAWKDWYYWSMFDEEGQKEAKKRLDEAGKELMRIKGTLA